MRLKPRIISTLFSCVLLPSITFSVHAQSSDLLSLYENAENYDSGIFAAESAYLAEKEGEKQALSALLPQVNATVGWSRTDSNTHYSATGHDSYKSRSDAISLSQPLLNLQSWHSLTSSEQNSLRAKAAYLSAKQSLMLDVASAYFNVLRGQENLRSDKSQEAAVKRQYEQAKEQFDVGLIAITDVHEAKASYDASQTARIRSEGNLTIAQENLGRITGKFAQELHTLRDDFPIEMDNTSTEKWVESALTNNLDVQIAQYAVQTQKASLKATRSQHYPTVDLQANYSNTHFGNYDPGDDNAESSSVTLNLNLPLYSGGRTQAGIRQARYRLEEAKHQLQSAQRQAKIETRTEYINLKTNIQTVDSLKQNIISRESALEATREGYKVGTRNIVEVLDAEKNYFTALRDYANARFDFVESSLRIKQAAGTLSIEDIKQLNSWLQAVNN